jgi:ribosome biogenesis GTPase
MYFYHSRNSVKLSKESHILAANIDQAFIVVTKKHPVTTLNFIDRFLVTAEAYNIPAVVVFNKIDIYTSKEMEKVNEWYGIYHEIGYKCLATSTKTGQGMDELKKLMTNKTSVFTGNSGVGKSSLINYIDSNLNLKTDIISEASHKSGKHTTFGMIDMKDDDVSHYFPEIFAISEACKFNNCTHTHEPGCNVKVQVEAGEISISRYESYLSILGEDEDEKYRIGF